MTVHQYQIPKDYNAESAFKILKNYRSKRLALASAQDLSNMSILIA
jgi:hypothetical protein